MTLRTHLDGRVFAEHLEGRPPLILALHGWGRDRHDLLDVVAGREVISLDLPGFGASPPPVEVWGAADYAEATARLLTEAQTGPVVVLAHSFGGRVAAHLAAEHPHLVRGVVFAGVPLLRSQGPAPKSPLPYRIVRRLHRMKIVPDSMLESMRQRYGSADYRAATGTMRDILVTVVNEDYREELSAMEVPVGFCWGADDTAARADIARQAAKLVPNCVVLDIVDEVGHDVHRQAPERLASVLDQVIAASEASQ